MAHVLLVDDDGDLAETLKEVFELESHSCDCVETAEQALERLSKTAYDLVLLDWQLPDMDGLEVCRRYRAAGGKDRIVMLTGMRDAQSRQAGRQAGADDFLTKPFTVDQLLERMAAYLGAT
ncbi:MAG TPA: response regulator transcription factor [Candidatus Obscuribacterales bacterium]